MTADATGIFPIEAAAYHADPCETPSLSASLAHILLTQSPRHAWEAHPKLNPMFRRTDDAKFEVGTAAHAMLLQGSDIISVVAADSWRTNAAKEARDEARIRALVPLLADQAGEVANMYGAVRAQLPSFNVTPPLLADGQPEQTLIWEEDGGVVCRARLDWLRDDHATIDDLKTTSRSANPEAWSRSLYGFGADLQAAFYLRGLEKVTGSTALFRWVVAETSPPYAVSVVSLSPAALALAEAKVDAAIDLWRECLRTDTWPGYPTEVCYAELPPWEEARWLEREARA